MARNMVMTWTLGLCRGSNRFRRGYLEGHGGLVNRFVMGVTDTTNP